MCVVCSLILVTMSPSYATIKRDNCFLSSSEPTSWRKVLTPEKMLARGLTSAGRRLLEEVLESDGVGDKQVLALECCRSYEAPLREK